MAEELGRIEKPEAADFKKGRRLYFVPLIYCEKEAPEEYVEKFNRYWSQVEDQIGALERKLGRISRIYHELISEGGDEGVRGIKTLNERSYQVTENRLAKGACLEAVEEGGLLSEFMDWSRCLVVGLENESVFTKVYRNYTAAAKRRGRHIAKRIDETLDGDEVGVFFMREGYQVRFKSDIQVFYVSPPALDEIKRWFRQHGDEPPRE